jgi:hypothetical protein
MKRFGLNGICRGGVWLLVVAALGPACTASVTGFSSLLPKTGLLANDESIRNVHTQPSLLAVESRTEEKKSCEVMKPAEALATPDPLIPGNGVKIRLSFIIGSDGQVHSPIVLESAGTVQDRVVLETVQSWRYRPASCNSVPSESEARVEFSSR